MYGINNKQKTKVDYRSRVRKFCSRSKSSQLVFLLFMIILKSTIEHTISFNRR